MKPCEHVYNTHGICQHCGAFDKREPFPVGAKEFAAEQSDRIRKQHAEPLQTRLQKRVIALRGAFDSPDAALLEEAIAEIQRLEDVHTKIVTLLTPKK